MKKIIIVGAGGHGKSIAETIQLTGAYEILGFIDDSYPERNRVWEYNILANIENAHQFYDKSDCTVIAIGNNSARESLHKSLKNAGIPLATIVHPTAFVSPTARVGCGSTIMARAVVNTEAVLGEGVIVNCGAIIDHHCEIKDFGHLGVATAMAGGTQLGYGAWLQAGVSLGYGKIIEDWKIIS